TGNSPNRAKQTQTVRDQVPAVTAHLPTFPPARYHRPTMKDPRYTQLARTLVQHSMQVARGDKVFVEAFDIPNDFTVELIRTIADAGGLPLVSTKSQQIQRALFNVASPEQMKLIGQIERLRMENVQCYA